MSSSNGMYVVTEHVTRCWSRMLASTVSSFQPAVRPSVPVTISLVC